MGAPNHAHGTGRHESRPGRHRAVWAATVGYDGEDDEGAGALDPGAQAANCCGFSEM